MKATRTAGAPSWGLILAPCLVLLAPACAKISSINVQVTGFGTELSRGDLAAAYGRMCPEYREKATLDRFSQDVRSCPYLEDLRSLDCTVANDVVGFALHANNCTLVNRFGRMPGNIYVRDQEEGSCIVSIVVAGMPVIGP